jgi:hypothetical protein
MPCPIGSGLCFGEQGLNVTDGVVILHWVVNEEGEMEDWTGTRDESSSPTLLNFNLDCFE